MGKTPCEPGPHGRIERVKRAVVKQRSLVPKHVAHQPRSSCIPARPYELVFVTLSDCTAVAPPFLRLSAFEDSATLSPNGDNALFVVERQQRADSVDSGGSVRTIQTTRAFGAEVRRARKDQRMSQAQLATKAGVGRPWLSELETGKRTVELGRALSVLSALDLAVTFVRATKVSRSGIDLDRLIAETIGGRAEAGCAAVLE